MTTTTDLHVAIFLFLFLSHHSLLNSLMSLFSQLSLSLSLTLSSLSLFLHDSVGSGKTVGADACVWSEIGNVCTSHFATCLCSPLPSFCGEGVVMRAPNERRCDARVLAVSELRNQGP